MRKLHSVLTILLLVVLAAVSDFAEAAAIRIVPTGTAAYSITATDLQDSAGMDLSIWYDSTSLKDPQVISGGLIAGAMMVLNTATSEFIRIGIMTGGVIKGTGELASITFTKQGTAPAPLPKFSSVNVISTSGSQLAVQSGSDSPQPPAENKIEDTAKNNTGAGSGTSGGVTSASSADVVLTTPNPPAENKIEDTAKNNTGAGSSTSSGVTSTSTGVVSTTPQTTTTIGSVLLPQDMGSKNDLIRQDSRREEPREVPVYQNETVHMGGSSLAPHEDVVVAAKTEAKASGTLPTSKSSQSVLERFRIYNDIRLLKRLSTLFDESALRAAGFVQTPAIVVSDGKSLVTITIILPNETDVPSFSLKGANQKSVRRISDKKWELDAVPQKNKSDVRLSILMKGERIEIPLVVVPPLHSTGTALLSLSESDLNTLLAKPFKNNKPAYDLNSDGKQDYIDDYTLVAHWLLKQQRSGNNVGHKPAAAAR